MLQLLFLPAAVFMAGAVLPGAVAEPDDVLLRARAAIVARVGEAAFHDYVGPLSATSYPPDVGCIEGRWSCTETVRKGYTFVTFRFRVPEVSFVDTTLECVIDADGKVSTLAAPKCASDPRECVFPYDATAVQAIARAARLEPGIKPWDVKFYWHYGFETFVWSVSNTLHEDKHSGDGQIVLIDANDGHVLGGIGGWWSID